MHHPPPRRRRLPLTALALALAAAGLVCGPTLVAAPAHAADRGVGFGTWAPLSMTGWHGSMRVGDLHTYCIHPGLPLATGTTTDQGIRTDANGLSPQQLVSINYLVTTYGQTDDPVQAAGVGWAVKAIVDRDTTLHSWGYEGDSFREAIDYIMRRASPENSAAIQDRAERYLAEAATIRVPRIGGTLQLTTDPDDPTRGSVTADVDPDATGGLHLDGAVAVRYFTTPGQQESAGPAEPARFDLTAQDATPRAVRFSPRIQTVARLDGGRFVDDVSFAPGEGIWPRHTDGTFVRLRARADVYRTGAYPAESREIPAGLEPVARLELTTDPATGPGTYTTSTTDPLPGPGVYTAVWRIELADQDAETLPHLPTRYRWIEKFATPAQTQQVVQPPAPPVPTPTPTTSPTLAPPPAAQPPTTPLAATGISSAGLAAGGSVGAVAIAAGVAAIVLARRRILTRI